MMNVSTKIEISNGLYDMYHAVIEGNERDGCHTWTTIRIETNESNNGYGKSEFDAEINVIGELERADLAEILVGISEALKNM